MSVVYFDQVSFIREKKPILKDITWKVNEKENWAILGLNGSGKTTLLQLMCGYLWPSKGHLTVLGNQFGKTSIPELQKKIGWVSSALQYRLHDYDLAEDIVLSGKFASIGIYQQTTKADRLAAQQLLTECGGGKLIGKTYGILSQGQQQIVLIARALMGKPQILILDEPCNGLDLFAKERLLHRVAQLAQRPEAPTLIYVSHHTEEILPCFDKLMLLQQGQIYRQGETSDLLHVATLNDFYPEPVQLLPIAGHRIAVYPTNHQE